MAYILIVFLAAIVGEVFLFKLYGDGGKILQKYDASHSDIRVESAEDFVAAFKSTNDLGVSGVECEGNKVKLTCGKYNYTICVNDGVATVEYDRAGCGGVKISAIGRLIRISKFTKSVKKALVINGVMDKIAGKDSSHSIVDNKKIKLDKRIIKISLIAAVLFAIIGGCSLVGDMHEEAITSVKTTVFNGGVTYETIINNYVKNAEWSAFVSDDGDDMAVIEVKGTSVEGEKIQIQFWGNSGMKFDTTDYKLSVFNIDDQSLEPEAAMKYLCEYLGY